MSAVSRREWLLAEKPASRRQARLGQAYRTWLRADGAVLQGYRFGD